MVVDNNKSCMVVNNNNNSAVDAAMYLTSSKPSSASTTLLSALTPSLDDNLENNRDRWVWYDTTVTEMTGGGTLELCPTVLVRQGQLRQGQLGPSLDRLMSEQMNEWYPLLV